MSASITEPQDGVRISLDAAQVCFIESEKLVLSLKGGELYVLTLCADSMRSVRSFHFSKAAASVLTSCVSFGASVPTLFPLKRFFVPFSLFADLCLRNRVSVSRIPVRQFAVAEVPREG